MQLKKVRIISELLIIVQDSIYYQLGLTLKNIFNNYYLFRFLKSY